MNNHTGGSIHVIVFQTGDLKGDQQVDGAVHVGEATELLWLRLRASAFRRKQLLEEICEAS